MMKNIPLVICFLAPIFFQAQNFQGASLTLDQDFFTPPRLELNKDQNYTQGFFLNFNGDFAEYVYPLSKPRAFLDKVFKLDTLRFLHVRGMKSTSYFNFAIGGSGFTPQNIGTPVIIENDRPYSSFLMFSSGRTSVRQEPRPNSSSNWKVVSSDFTLNILGLGFARNIQSNIHEAMLEENPNARPIPLGWDNQISNGGEPSILYRVNMTQRLLDQYIPSEDKYKPDYHIFQMSHQIGMSLGYYTYLTTGVNFRFGLIRSRIFIKNMGLNGIAGLGNKALTQLKSSSLNSTEEERRMVKEKTKKAVNRQFEIYIFGSTNTTLFLYNAALSGQFRITNYRMPYSQINPIVFTYDIGIAINYGWINCGYGIISRSPEFYGSEARTHTWGTIYLGIQRPIVL